MKPIKRRAFLMSLGAGASVGYLIPMKALSQSLSFNLSQGQYNEIHEIKVNLRIAYSYFCLSPEDGIDQLMGEIEIAQEKLDEIIPLDYVHLPDFVDAEPWSQTHMPSKAIDWVRLFIDNEDIPQRQVEIDPCTEAALQIFADVIGLTSEQMHQLAAAFRDINLEGISLLSELQELAESIMEGDFNRAKTHLEIILNVLTDERTSEVLIGTLRSQEFRMFVSWLVRRKVPVIGLALLIAELLIALYRNRESLNRCVNA